MNPSNPRRLLPLDQFTVGVDFDGTLVEHNYPDIGINCPGAFATLTKAASKGIRLILVTMRSDWHLAKAIEHCEDNGLTFWNHNRNPEQVQWTSSPKIYCHLYIDDAALGIPLEPAMNSNHPRVNWTNISRYFEYLYKRADKNGGYYDPPSPQTRNQILNGF